MAFLNTKQKNMKLILVFLVQLFCLELSAQQANLVQLTNQEKSTLLRVIETDTVFGKWYKDTSKSIRIYKQYKTEVLHSDSTWINDQERLQKIKDFGYTDKFELIPLVENLYGNNDLKKGNSVAGGVSYLIRTDHSTILFDTGYYLDSTICVLRYNLNKLGIDISEIDAIVISHNHMDHQDNWRWISDTTFINSKNENILPKMKIYVPNDKLNLKTATFFSHDPIKICEGVYTMGIIEAPLFDVPLTQEQSLMFNIKDRGIVIVTGCGHQTVEKMLQRYDKLSRVPIYGILGGLHLLVLDKGSFIAGLLPWEPFTIDDVNRKVGLIKTRNVKLIGISTHDSSPNAIESFKIAFPTEYKDLRVGEWLVVK
jgi:7,8-dihydropterin-6-yl-methyl-4-(beta-D-ribofuranosyl)aminobenzene 5'-phosphate synthase